MEAAKKAVIEGIPSAAAAVSLHAQVASSIITPVVQRSLSTAAKVGADAAKVAAKEAITIVKEHPGLVAGVGISAAIVAAPGLVTVPALQLAGFAPSLTAGSMGATIQAVIGNPVAGGVFATIQSAGAGGYGVAVVNGVVQAAAGAAGAATAVAAAGVAAAEKLSSTKAKL